MQRRKIGLCQIKASLVLDEPPDFLFKWIFSAIKEDVQKEEKAEDTRKESSQRREGEKKSLEDRKFKKNVTLQVWTDFFRTHTSSRPGSDELPNYLSAKFKKKRGEVT